MFSFPSQVNTQLMISTTDMYGAQNEQLESEDELATLVAINSGKIRVSNYNRELHCAQNL